MCSWVNQQVWLVSPSEWPKSKYVYVRQPYYDASSTRKVDGNKLIYHHSVVACLISNSLFTRCEGYWFTLRRLIGRSGWLVSTNVYTFIWLIFAKKVNLLCSSLPVTYMEFYYSPLVSFWWWNANWLARYWIDCDLMSCEEFLSIIFFYCKYFYGFDLNYDKGACNWKIS